MKRFGLIGAAGYIASRHAKVLSEAGCQIVTACDLSDSVGMLDAFAPDCRFTTNQQKFFAELDDVDAVVVCTPNYMHPTHAIRALEAGCNVILEKPLAPRATGVASAEYLIQNAADYDGKIYPIVQLRHDAQIAELRREVMRSRKTFDCEIDYVTYRGPWYKESWKGNKNESGGLLVNIGVHLFDLCCYCFGRFVTSEQATLGDRESSGVFHCEKATVKWRLSIAERGKRRVFRVSGREIDLSNRMAELHAEAYRHILADHVWALEDVSQALYAIATIEQTGRGHRAQSQARP